MSSAEVETRSPPILRLLTLVEVGQEQGGAWEERDESKTNRMIARAETDRTRVGTEINTPFDESRAIRQPVNLEDPGPFLPLAGNLDARFYVSAENHDYNTIQLKLSLSLPKS